MVDDTPRRCQLEKMIPAECAILDAMQVVERAGCDVRLTEAVILLQKARDKVADFVDGVESMPEHRGIACEDHCGTRLETWWCAACNAKHGRPPQYVQEVDKLVAERDAALARIKSLEDGIVAENKRTSAIEEELQAVKETLIGQDGYHPDGSGSVAIVVNRILNERDDAKEKCAEQLERIKGLEHDTVVLNEARTREVSVPEPKGASPVLGDMGAIRSFLIEQGEYSRFSGLSVFVSVARILHERNTERRDLSSIRDMLADIADNPVEEHKRLRAPDETAAAVSALLSHNKGQENSLETQSKALDASEERASTATDVLCMALGKDHGRGGLVEHCQKAAEKIRTLEVRLAVWQPQVVGAEPVKCLSCYTLSAKLVEAERERGELVQRCQEFQRREDEYERKDFATLQTALRVLMEDQRATGDVLAGILERERCEDGNVCLANEVGLKVEELQTACDSYHLGSCYAEEPCLECAAAKRRRESRQAKNSGGASGAAQADVAQRGQSNEGTHGPLDRPAPPEPAGDSRRVSYSNIEALRDSEWALAMAKALGTNSGFKIPIRPDVEVFRCLFEDVQFHAIKQQRVPEPAGDQRCSSCRGSGTIRYPRPGLVNATVTKGCSDCGGTGRSATSSRPWLCKTCGGDTRYVGNKRGCKCKVSSKRWKHFNDTTAALSGGNQHPDRCVCQGDEPTPHKHYDDEPHACARCSCREYRAHDDFTRQSKPPTDLVSREQLIAACKRAAGAGDGRGAFEALVRALEKL